MRRAALAAGAAAAGFGWMNGQLPSSQLYGATINRERGAGRLIALTYDDGPNPRHTPDLVEVLERHGAHATFLLIGRWAEREPGLVRELAAAGHAIGNHTYTHPTMPLRSVRAIRDELARCRGAVEGAGVAFSEVDGAALMRPPYGRRRPATLRTLRHEGYVPLLWSITCWDWRPRRTAKQVTRHSFRARGGDIVLLHDGGSDEPAADRSASVAATEDTIRRFAAEGFRFVSVPELVAAARGERDPTL